MSTISQNNVIGIFDDSGQAHEALTDLRRAAFRDAELGVLSNVHHTLPHSPENPIPFVDEERVEATQDVTTGALVGAGIGSIGALSLATLMIPGFGPMLVGGFFALLGLGMVGGAMAGGMIGSLIGIGVPERHAETVQEAILAGYTVVNVRTADRQDEAAAIMDRHGARPIETETLSAIV